MDKLIGIIWEICNKAKEEYVFYKNRKNKEKNGKIMNKKSAFFSASPLLYYQLYPVDRRGAVTDEKADAGQRGRCARRV